jgi:hypothetical protein
MFAAVIQTPEQILGLMRLNCLPIISYFMWNGRNNGKGWKLEMAKIERKRPEFPMKYNWKNPLNVSRYKKFTNGLM